MKSKIRQQTIVGLHLVEQKDVNSTQKNMERLG